MLWLLVEPPILSYVRDHISKVEASLKEHKLERNN